MPLSVEAIWERAEVGDWFRSGIAAVQAGGGQDFIARR